MSTLTKSRRTIWWVSGASVAVAAAVTVALVGVPRLSTVAAASCPATDRPLRVVVTPDLAPVVTTVAHVLAAGSGGSGGSGAGATSGTGDSCTAPVVVAANPADTTRLLQADSADRPDVWIPDSSAWIGRITAPGKGVPSGNPSVASSPFVVAVASTLGQRFARTPHAPLHVADLLHPPADGTTPPRWEIADSSRSMSSAAALVTALSDLSTGPTGAAAVTALLRGSDVTTSTDLTRTFAVSAVDRAATPATVAVPTTEQAVFAFNRDHPNTTVLPAYADAPSVADYPFITLSTELSRRRAATALLTALEGELGRRLMAAVGFRDPAGVPGASLVKGAGITPLTTTSRPLTASAVTRALTALAAVRRPSRLLAVVDVSASMTTPVAAAGGRTRIDITLSALTTGLAVYPDETAAGLWMFSTHLTGAADYRVLVPPVLLGTGADGTSGRARLAQAIAGVQATTGGTGLYDTVLAAVRSMRGSWDPARVNSIVVVTDGGNNDPGGIDLPTLLKTLAAEADPTRPVTVFAIALGPDADTPALRSIAAATGGAAYSVTDPRTIGGVLMDAVGRRACAPACS